MTEITLETDRLLLRPWRLGDFDAYARMCADSEVMRHLNDAKPFTVVESWRSMAAHVGHWCLRGFGHWAVEEKATGDFIGRLGLMHPEGWPDFELGWTLRRESWGRGYATEGARQALAYAFDDLGRDHVISLIVPANVPSIRVAERLGEHPEGTIEFLGKEHVVYGIDRQRWRAGGGAK